MTGADLLAKCMPPGLYPPELVTKIRQLMADDFERKYALLAKQMASVLYGGCSGQTDNGCRL